ncbi:unnamed protein product [Rhizophagus irregularis]|nr:unnamed protein product [Rhizophagus irregularis]CAB4411301.1 unnamed protein product [Rhizophagus irregularis]
MLETLPTFFDAYKLMSENPLKDPSAYRKTIMNQDGSRPYVTETNKETSDYIQNARAAKDMINYAVTQEVFEFNIQFYFMDYLTQYCIFEIETCEIPIDWKETLQFTSFYRAIVTWALLVGEADKKFQQSRNKRSSPREKFVVLYVK